MQPCTNLSGGKYNAAGSTGNTSEPVGKQGKNISIAKKQGSFSTQRNQKAGI